MADSYMSEKEHNEHEPRAKDENALSHAAFQVPEDSSRHNAAYQSYLTHKEKKEADNNSEKREGFWSEIIRFSVIALIVVIPIRIFIAQPFIVSGASMDPTFANGQYLIVDQLSYRFEVPERGDVIIFRYPRDTSKFFIKRIIALPGETIKIDGNDITIINPEHPDGFELNEFYVKTMRPDTVLETDLLDGQYFVMGDNRDFSSDSRVWGVLPEDHIVGRAYLRLLPADEIGLLPGKVLPEAVEIIEEE